MAWNQSVTRTRWLAVKLAVIGVAAMATTGLLSLMLTWWSSPIDRAVGLNPTHGITLIRIAPVLFDARGITPVAYAAFAFALGVTAGALTRRTIPAMAAALAVFAIIQLATPDWTGRTSSHPPTPPWRSTRKHPRDKRLNRARDALLHPARRLDPLQPGHRQDRPRVPRRAHPGLPERQLPGVPGLDRQTSPPAADHLPARQPLLGLPVV
jgi:hypothetical protein